jgi:hypothetical protein
VANIWAFAGGVPWWGGGGKVYFIKLSGKKVGLI